MFIPLTESKKFCLFFLGLAPEPASQREICQFEDRRIAGDVVPAQDSSWLGTYIRDWRWAPVQQGIKSQIWIHTVHIKVSLHLFLILVS
jgi:hypothetical protein